MDFSAAKSTVFSLLGSNGAGKTMLIHILATPLKADGGPAEFGMTLMFLSYFTGVLVPIETMPKALQILCTYQPVNIVCGKP